jgi:hypothetical protein
MLGILGIMGESVRRLKKYIVAICNFTLHKALLGRVKWSEHVARMGERRGIYRILVGTRESGFWKNPDVYGRIILKWIFNRWDKAAWTGLISFRIRAGGGLL